MSHHFRGPADRSRVTIAGQNATEGSASVDIYEVDRLRAELEMKNREIEDLRNQLRTIHTSDGWAMLRTLTQLRHAVAPHGTVRDRLAMHAVKILRRVKKSASRLITEVRAGARLTRRGQSNEVEIDASTADRYAILCLPMIEWGFRFQRPQQIMRQLALADHAVFYAANRFHTGAGPKVRGIEKNVVEVILPGDPIGNVYQTLPSPEDTARMVAAITSLRTERNLSDVVIVAQLPYWTDLAVALRERFGWPIVYDCMDDHSGFLHNSGQILETENHLVQASDLVVTSSTLLHQSVVQTAQSSILIRNACDYDHFRTALSGNSSGIVAPTIGYYGAIAEWFDSDLVATLARLRPNWRFEMIGSTLAGDVRSLQECRNVRFLGEKPYADLPRLISNWDAFIIPFKRVPLTEATNPVKVYEMLATGKAVVAVSLPELLPIAELGVIRIADTGEQFASALDWELSTATPDLERRRRAFAERNTWQARARELTDAIDRIRSHRLAGLKTEHFTSVRA